MDRRRVRPAVVHGNAHEDIVGGSLRILDEHVEVAVGVEYARVEQLVFRFAAAARAVLLHQVRVRESRLRVLVQELHVGMGRRAVEVEVVLLDVLAVVALAVGETEQPLLQDRVAPVPEREREAQPLLVVADAAEPVFAPAVGAGSRLLVREVVPGVAVLAVVLADRAPLALAEVRAPFLPGRAGVAALGKASLFVAGWLGPVIGLIARVRAQASSRDWMRSLRTSRTAGPRPCPRPG